MLRACVQARGLSHVRQEAAASLMTNDLLFIEARSR
jgi:hypothetical protein